MSMWRWTGKKFVTASLASDDLGADAYLFCPGPSLKTVNDRDIHVPGAMAFAVNTAYPHIRPDVWIGLDRVECYDRRLWWEPFTKIMRGNYFDMTCGGIPIKRLPNAYFADADNPPASNPYAAIQAKSDKFTFLHNIMPFAIHIMVYMGARRIHLVGCDLGGPTPYHDGRPVTPGTIERNAQQYEKVRQFLVNGIAPLRKIGVELISCTEQSPLNAAMPYIPLAEALEASRQRPAPAALRRYPDRPLGLDGSARPERQLPAVSL